MNKFKINGSTLSSRPSSSEEKFQRIFFGILNDIPCSYTWFFFRKYPEHLGEKAKGKEYLKTGMKQAN